MLVPWRIRRRVNREMVEGHAWPSHTSDRTNQKCCKRRCEFPELGVWNSTFKEFDKKENVSMKFYIKEKACISSTVLWSAESPYINAKYYFYSSQYFRWPYFRIIESRLFFKSPGQTYSKKFNAFHMDDQVKIKIPGRCTRPPVIYYRSMSLEAGVPTCWTPLGCIPNSFPVHQNSLIRSAEMGRVLNVRRQYAVS